jgi:hypothetical protein
MVTVKMADHLFLRPGFNDLSLVPETHSQFMFGEKDRQLRDELLECIEEGHVGGEGHKAVRAGDYGRGKTQQSHNLVYEIKRRGLPIRPVYVKCTEFKKNEPFSTLFADMVMKLGTQEVKQLTHDFQNLVGTGQGKPLNEVITSEEILAVFETLSSPNQEVVRYAMKWLGGDTSLTAKQREQLGAGLGAPVNVSRDFAEVLRGFSHMYQTVKGVRLLYIIDEAERLALIENTDAFWSWMACWRELLEIVGVGFVIFIGAKRREAWPAMMVEDEIGRRIGWTNYVDIKNHGREELRQWLEEMLQTFFRKGAVPPPLVDAVTATAGAAAVNDTAVPTELINLIGNDPAALAAYPFTPAAMDAFIDQCVSEDLANRPSEVLKRVRKATARIVRTGASLVDADIIDQIQSGAL